ncbi:MAG: TetR/AcrR family transcriptional regulator [Terracidiphilus sp.]|jgi:AcrR family transcriptional regulator
MARPKSEDKRKAILDAALRVFAEHGIANAPTSAISKAAGVAEGSLFTYFKTKEELLSALYFDLRMEFSRHLPDFPHGTNARTRLKYIWDQYLELGASHPEQLKVLKQLRATGRLFREDETPAFAFVEVLKATHDAVQGKELQHAPPEYLVLVMRAQAEMTLEYIHAHPQSAEICRELGFKMVWAGLTGK